MSILTTTFNFTLPRGLVDGEGRVHRHGVMRLATAKDEMRVMKTPDAQENQSIAAIAMLSQVITQLGDLSAVTPEILENLFSLDFAYLREFYNRVNQEGEAIVETQCPSCNHAYQTAMVLAGE